MPPLEEQVNHDSDNRTASPAFLRLACPDMGEAELAAVARVLQSGRLVQGSEVAAFERELAAFVGCEHVVVVSSGTAALHVLFLALDFPPGRAVFIPSFAWPSAANVATLCELTPVFVDVAPDSYNLDPDALDERIRELDDGRTIRACAVVAVHEFGLPCDLDRITALCRRYGLTLIEDAACALGAKWRGRSVGRWGRAGIFSFHPRKSLTTGEGGAIVTDDAELAARCRALRDHGRVGPLEFGPAGLNYRMTEIQAAIGRVQLDKFPDMLQYRSRLAEKYHVLLDDLPGLVRPPLAPLHTWQTYMAVVEDGVDRDRLIRELHARGIETGPGSIAAHLLPAFASLPAARPLPVSERLFRQGLALPMHTRLSSDDIRRVADALRNCVASLSAAAAD